MGMVKNGCGQSGHGTLILTVIQKWTDGMNWFLHAGANSGSLKVTSVILGLLVYETLKSAFAVSCECIYWADFGMLIVIQ